MGARDLLEYHGDGAGAPAAEPPQDVAGLVNLIKLRAHQLRVDGFAVIAAEMEQTAAALAALAQERKDWARRFTLNGVTPWEWMTRATKAERERDEAREELQNARANRFDRDAFESDTAFAEWAQSRASHTLAAIDAARKGEK